MGQVTGYPPEFAQRYRDRGYWIGQTHSALLATAVSQYASRTAVIDDRRTLTYAELLAGAHDLAHGFVGLGLAPGDRVVVQIPNVSEYLEVVFGLFDAGLVPVFALPAHGGAEIDDLLTRSGATAYITLVSEELAQAQRGRGVQVVDAGRLADLRTGASSSTGRSSTPDAVAFLQLSGGTTGAPKLIPRTHDDYLYSVRESARICELTPDSVFGVVLPVSHNFTMSSPGVLGAIHAGSTIVMVGAPDAETVFGAVAEHGITQLSAVPPLVAAWLDSPARTAHDLSSLAVLQVGGAKLSRALAERVPDAFGVCLQQVFGMAEGLVNYTRFDDDLDTILDTQGRPISPDDEVRVVDAAGDPVPDGTPGALQTRGPYTIRGYWAGQSPESFTGDGFYRTGDIVVRDDRGYLRVVGRDKDQINRAGEKIAPEEVENHLISHPAVRDASVVGVPDDRLGEKTLAYLVLSNEVRAERTGVDAPDEFAIRGYLRERGLARFKIPDQILFVDAFPTTGVGKVSKNAQRDTDAGRAQSVGTDNSADGVLADFAGKLGVDPAALSGSMAVADTGIDSLALMALIDKWRAQGAVGLEFEALATAETLDDLIAAVRDAQDQRAG